MPIEIISGLVAADNIKSNPVSNWPTRGVSGGRMEPFAQPAFRPTFKLISGEPVFTIGSCFARNIELLLAERGFQIPTREVIKADPDFAAIGHNVLNNYGVPSIFNEVSWALDPERPFREEEAFFEVYPGKFADAHLNHALKLAPLETLRARRRAIINAYKTLSVCRVVIITLGLAECWFDRRTGVYLNTVPRRTMVRGEPNRFELHVMSYEETHGYLNRILDLIKTYGHPEVRVLLTVSPVPLTSTHRNVDVMIANTYSKAVLRVAAEVATLSHDFVDYFPSYESITLSERSIALQDDQIHPTPEAIRLNVTRMVRAYVGEEELSADSVREQIAMNPALVLGLLEGRDDLTAENPDLALALARAALRGKRFELVPPALAQVGDLLSLAESNIMRAEVALAQGLYEVAAGLLQVEPEAKAARGSYWSALLQTRIALGDLDGAREAAARWAQLNVRTPEPYRILAVACSKAGDSALADSLFDQALNISDTSPLVMLDYLSHLSRTGRRDKVAEILPKIKVTNPSHVSRLKLIQAGLE